jgi:hypothetical protein
MSFSKLVRYEDGGMSTFGDLVKSNDEGFVVKKLDDSIEDGFTPTAEDAVQVEKVGGTKIAISSPAC